MPFQFLQGDNIIGGEGLSGGSVGGMVPLPVGGATLDIDFARNAWATPLGPNLVSNGSFDTDLSGWTLAPLNGATIVWDTGRARLIGGGTVGNGYMYATIPVVLGKTYELKFDFTSASQHFGFSLGNTIAGTHYFTASGAALGTGSTKTYTFIATATTVYLGFFTLYGTSTTAYLDNVSVREVNPPVTGSVASLLTTVRASTGMAQRLDGSWIDFAANVPRITDRGLLVEENRTNYVRNSMDMLVPNGAAGGWGGTNTTLSRASFPAPDGSMTATVVTSTAVNSDHYIEQWPVTLVPVNAPITISCFVRDISRRYVTINFYDATTTANFVAVTYDLQTLAASAPFAGGAATAISHSITPLGTGWFRLTLTATLSAAATTGIIFRIRNAQGLTTATGHPGNGEEIAVWGAQAEPGTFATSPIRTTTAAATRVADQVQMPVGGWLNPAAMTVFAQFSTAAPHIASKYPGLVALNNSASASGYNDRVNLILNGNDLQAKLTIVTAGVNQVESGRPFTPDSLAHKLAGAATVNDAIPGLDGVLGAADPLVTLPTGINRLEFGVLVQGAQHLNGTIQRVAVYPTRLSNADLQTLTA